MRAILPVLLLSSTAPRTPCSSFFAAPPPTALTMAAALRAPSLLGRAGRVLPGRVSAVRGPGRGWTRGGRRLHDVGQRRWIRCTDLRLASHGGGGDDDYEANGADGSDPLRPRLRRLRDLNGGSDVNPRSPRQVSRLLFGAEGRPTDRPGVIVVALV